MKTYEAECRAKESYIEQWQYYFQEGREASRVRDRVKQMERGVVMGSVYRGDSGEEGGNYWDIVC